MSTVSAEEVRAFLLECFSEDLPGKGLDPSQAPDDLDLLMEGIIDSFGILEMISEVESRFGIEVDFEHLDAEDLTVIGPFSRYVAAHADEDVTDGNGM